MRLPKTTASPYRLLLKQQVRGHCVCVCVCLITLLVRNSSAEPRPSVHPLGSERDPSTAEDLMGGEDLFGEDDDDVDDEVEVEAGSLIEFMADLALH